MSELNELITELKATVVALDLQIDELAVFAKDAGINIHKVCDHTGDLAIAPILVAKANALAAIAQLETLVRTSETNVYADNIEFPLRMSTSDIEQEVATCLFEASPRGHFGTVQCDRQGCTVTRTVSGDAWSSREDPPLSDCVEKDGLNS